MMRLLLALTAALLVLAAPAAAQQRPVVPDAGGIRNVLSVGQGSNATTQQVAANTATGVVPPSFVNQRAQYRELLFRAPVLGAADLTRHFKAAPLNLADAEVGDVQRPRLGVTIVRDKAFGVPHVHGETREATLWATGYVSGQERLFVMDVLRHYGRARLSELTGAGRNDVRIGQDAEQLMATGYTEAELQRQIDQLPERYGSEGAQAKQDLLDFTAGVNAFIEETRLDASKLPGEYPLLGKTPQPWKPTDSVAAASLIGGIFGRGGGKEHLSGEVLAALRGRFGPRRARRVFNDLRRPDDPEAPVTTSRRFPFDDPGRLDRKAIALPDAGSVRPRNPIVSGSTARAVPNGGQAGARLASNALLVSASRSRSGRPMAVMGPQVEWYSPQILFEMVVQGPGISARGATFPGVSLVVLIGRGKDFAWSATTATTDNVDVFAEELCEPDGSAPSVRSTHYRHRGTCRPMEVRPHVIEIAPSPGANAGAPRTVRMEVRRTVHGPVQATGTSDGKPVAFVEQRSSYGSEVDAIIAFRRLNDGEVTDGTSFQRAMDFVPFAFNWFYSGPRDIAYLQSGWYPRRAKGTDLDLPTWGTGEWEWRARRLPFERLPKALNPPEGYIANWNGKQAPGWRAADDQWAYGSVQRVQRFLDPLKRDLRRGGKVDLTRMVQLVELAATRDVRGQSVLPWVLRAMRGTEDPRAKGLMALLERWSRGGAHRRDLDDEGTFEDSAAVALMDAWEPLLVRAVLEPVVGKEALDRAFRINPIIDTPPYNKGSGFGSGWYGQVQKDLRSLLGKRVKGPLSRRYCGEGVRAACRAALVRSLLRAAEEVSTAQGSPDPARWRVPATCRPLGSGEPLPKRCDQIEFQTLGGVATPPIPWQDRPTFQQVVEVGAP